MAQQVDPFVYPIPRKILKDPELRPFFEYFQRWAHDIWLRTGGSSDSVSDADIAELYPWQLTEKGIDIPWQLSLFSRNIAEIPYIPASSNHTCYGPEIVEATSNITITLNQEPEEGERCVFKRNTTAGNVILSGGSFNIDGESTYTMALNYEGIQTIFNGTGYLII